MSIRLKKLLITMLVAVMFTTTVYAGTFNIEGVVEGATYNECHFSREAEQKNNYNKATITLNSGAIYHYCSIYALSIDRIDPTSRTNFGNFQSNITVKNLTYTKTNRGDYYQVGAAIQRGSYVKRTTVSGVFTP